MLERNKEYTINDILKQFKEAARLPDQFFMRNNSEVYAIFEAIEHIPFLSLTEKFTIAKAPIHIPSNHKKQRGMKKDVLQLFTNFIE